MTQSEMPFVAKKPAIACTKDQCCMCRGVFAEVFNQWICPHCHSHLSTSNLCLNFCGFKTPES
jgi:Zn finger protein HypA/HybF involved in hydrogenase expression